MRQLGATEDGTNFLSLADRGGRTCVLAAVDGDGTSTLNLNDQAAKGRALLTVKADGNPCLTLVDNAGRPRATFGDPGLATPSAEEAKKGEAWLALFDKAGKIVFRAP